MPSIFQSCFIEKHWIQLKQYKWFYLDIVLWNMCHTDDTAVPGDLCNVNNAWADVTWWASLSSQPSLTAEQRGTVFIFLHFPEGDVIFYIYSIYTHTPYLFMYKTISSIIWSSFFRLNKHKNCIINNLYIIPSPLYGWF